MSVPIIAGLAAAQLAGSLYGAFSGKSAAEDASRLAAGQEQKGLDFQKKMYDETVGRMNPYVESGVKALGQYNTMLGDFKQPEFGYKVPDFEFDKFRDPGADYQMSRAQRALNSSSLSRGAAGGGFSKAMAEKQQELAGTAYQGSFNRYKDTTGLKYGEATDRYNRDYGYNKDKMGLYQGLIQGGQNAAAGMGSAGAEFGKNAMTGYSSLGQTLAGGRIGGSNALTTGLGQGINAISEGYGMYDQMNKQQEFMDWAKKNNVNPYLPQTPIQATSNGIGG